MFLVFVMLLIIATTYSFSENVLFYDLVVVVLRDDPVHALKASCLRFINALISTSDDIDARMRVRVAMMRLGLHQTVDTLWLAMPHNDEFSIEREILLEDEREDQLQMEALLKDVIVPMDNSTRAPYQSSHPAMQPPVQQRHQQQQQHQVFEDPNVVFNSVNPPTPQYQRIVASLLQVRPQRQGVWNVVEKVSSCSNMSLFVSQ
jgi:hypothetical protein